MGAAWLPSDQEASGRSFGDEELDNLIEVLRSGTLTATKGAMTPRLEAALAELLGVRHVVALSSGSAAVHTALAALDLEPGDEVITTSVTDMGALAPILQQGLIPVFADVDPVTLNVTAASIEARCSARTRAVIVTHLFGNPCEMRAIEALCARRALPIIEDAAQAYGARHEGRLVGTIGAIRQKIKGAERDGASYFLVPEGNCDNVGDLEVAIPLIKVGTLNDAISALQLINEGNIAEVPTCG